MASDRGRRLSRLEARRPPASPADAGRLRERLEFMSYLAARQPHESGADAIGRLLGLAPGGVVAALRSGDFAARWDDMVRPLRGLDGAAFAAACQAIRARHLPT